jgi:hypothetical protein
VPKIKQNKKNATKIYEKDWLQINEILFKGNYKNYI